MVGERYRTGVGSGAVHLTQIRLIVADFDGCVAFYRDVLGLTPQTDDPRPPYVAFKPELGSTLALHDRSNLAAALGDTLRSGSEAGEDAAMVSLRVDDLTAYLAEIAGRGAEILAGPIEYDGRIRCAYLRDPDRNLIEIQQWLATRTGEAVPSAG
ncbi:VOC family protein [Nocardia sp. NPDC004068]|uniref:VOC family protein n=1 Tax=Nocardia sp. NPDC004068 TaxID=3364303 RepID=UPI0036C621D3